MSLTKEEKLKRINAAISIIDKEYGKNSLMRLGESSTMDVEVISSGSLVIDELLGVGGFPRGRIVEIAGVEASGKTSVCLHTIAEAQKMGGICAFIDVEQSLDRDYAFNLGVNIEELLLSQPSCGEDALSIAEEVISSGGADIVVIDSVAALVPKAEIEGEMGDAHMALQARLMSQALRKLTGIVKRSNTILMFTNQYRSSIGSFYGPSEVTSGGNALKFYASVRIDIRRGPAIKKGEEVIGSTNKVKIVKNKVAPPFKKGEVTIMFGEGISHIMEILNYAVKLEIIDKAGSWFSYKDERLGQGLDNVKQFLLDNPSILEGIENKVKGILFSSKKREIEADVKVKKEEEKKKRKSKEEKSEGAGEVLD